MSQEGLEMTVNSISAVILLTLAGFPICSFLVLLLLAIMSDTKKSGGKMSEKNKLKGVKE